MNIQQEIRNKEQRLPIYLDYNATTPCDPEVVKSMLPYFTEACGNPASKDHCFGWVADEAVEVAREQVAGLIHTAPGNIVFTSGATESVNLALKGIVKANAVKGDHIITSKTEHKAVLDTCAYLEENGSRVTYLDVDANGEISTEDVEHAITGGTVCIALMYANNETGVINPVKEIGALAKRYGVYFFCDATQAVGKIPVDVGRDNIDLMACSAHKIYGPKGVGALYTGNGRPAISLPSQMHGGGQEKGFRSGTLNVPGIVGFGEAASLCRQKMQEEHSRLQSLRDRMEEELLRGIPGASLNGGKKRLPHVCNILFPGTDNEMLLLSLSKYMAISRGSACSSNVQQPSHVLTAMGLKEEDARHCVRISLGRFTTEEEVMFAIDVIKTAVRKCRMAARYSMTET